jgi:hypothetical protein
VSIVVVSSGDRHDDGGRKPVVQAGGSLREIWKLPMPNPEAFVPG